MYTPDECLLQPAMYSQDMGAIVKVTAFISQLNRLTQGHTCQWNVERKLEQIKNDDSMHAFNCMCVCAYIHSCMHACLHTCMHTFVCVHIYMHECVCVHKYMHAFMHAYVQIYMLTYECI